MVFVDRGDGVYVPEEYVSGGTPDLHSTVNPVVGVNVPAPTPAVQNTEQKKATTIPAGTSATDLLIKIAKAQAQQAKEIVEQKNSVTLSDGSMITDASQRDDGRIIYEVFNPANKGFETRIGTNYNDLNSADRAKIDNYIATRPDTTSQKIEDYVYGVVHPGWKPDNSVPVGSNYLMYQQVKPENRINLGGTSQNEDAYLIDNPYTGGKSIVDSRGRIYPAWTDVSGKSFGQIDTGLPAGTTIGGREIGQTQPVSPYMSFSSLTNAPAFVPTNEPVNTQPKSSGGLPVLAMTGVGINYAGPLVSDIVKGAVPVVEGAVKAIAGEQYTLDKINFYDPLRFKGLIDAAESSNQFFTDKTKELQAEYTSLFAQGKQNWNNIADYAISKGAPAPLVEVERAYPNFVFDTIGPVSGKLITSSVEGTALAVGGAVQFGAAVGLLGEANVQDIMKNGPIGGEIGGYKTNMYPIIPVSKNMLDSAVLTFTGGRVLSAPVTKETVTYGEPVQTIINNPDGSITVRTSTPVTTTTQTKQNVQPSFIETLGDMGVGLVGEAKSDPVGTFGKYVVPMVIFGGALSKVGKASRAGVAEEAGLFNKPGFGDPLNPIAGPFERGELSAGKVTPNQFTKDGFVKENGEIIGADRYGNLKPGNNYDGSSYDKATGTYKTAWADNYTYNTVTKRRGTTSSEYGYGNPIKNFGDEIIGGTKYIGETVINVGEKAIGYTSVVVGPGAVSEIADNYSYQDNEITIDNTVLDNTFSEINIPAINNKYIYGSDNKNVYGYENNNKYVEDNKNEYVTDFVNYYGYGFNTVTGFNRTIRPKTAPLTSPNLSGGGYEGGPVKKGHKGIGWRNIILNPIFMGGDMDPNYKKMRAKTKAARKKAEKEQSVVDKIINGPVKDSKGKKLRGKEKFKKPWEL
jgi:hypothetical protein